MPVEFIEFVFRHIVQDLKDFFLSEEMACFIQHESSPSVAGRILNDAAIQIFYTFAGGVLHLLQEGLDTVKNTCRIASPDDDLPG